MSIYVDQPDRKRPFKFGKGRFGYPCHLIADTHEELMSIAEKLKLDGNWIQCAGTAKEHFDITSGNRQVAIDRFQAKQITTREMILIIQRKREEEQQ